MKANDATEGMDALSLKCERCGTVLIKNGETVKTVDAVGPVGDVVRMLCFKCGRKQWPKQ